MAAIYEYTGVVEKVLQLQSFASGFTKRDVVMTDDVGAESKWPNHIAFTFKKDAASMLDTVREGQRALIVDDFMRAGGTARGMVDMMREFAVTVVGVCVMAATAEPQKKRIDNVKSLLVIEETDENTNQPHVRPASWLLQAAEKARV